MVFKINAKYMTSKTKQKILSLKCNDDLDFTYIIINIILYFEKEYYNYFDVHYGLLNT